MTQLLAATYTDACTWPQDCIHTPYTKNWNVCPLCICCHRKCESQIEHTTHPELSTWTSCKLASWQTREGAEVITITCTHMVHMLAVHQAMCSHVTASSQRSLLADTTMNTWLWLAFLQSCSCLKHSYGLQLGEDPREDSCVYHFSTTERFLLLSNTAS